MSIAPPSPSPARRAGPAQAVVLLIGSCASVLGSLLIAPVLPDLEKAFASTPGISTLAPLAMTLPALGIALLGPVAGTVVDRFGRVRLLRWSTAAYAVVGTAPLWLDNLAGVLVSRALLGVVEAAVMTCCLTLLGDYFHGAVRDRYMSWHSVITSFGAVVFLMAGGALGAAGWRTPFWVYALALPLLAFMVPLLREPERPVSPAQESGAVEPAGHGRTVRPLPWRRLSPMLTLTLVGAALVFFVLQVQLGFVLDDLGVGSAAIGASAAIANGGVMLTALLFVRFARHGAGRLLVAAFVLGPAGLIVMSVADSWASVTVGAFLAGLGDGLMLPSLLIGTTAQLDFDQRGRGTAAWTSVFYLGQFFSPVIVAALSAAAGGLSAALQISAVGGLVTAVAAAVHARRHPLHTSAEVEDGPSAPAGVDVVDGSKAAETA
ncbi:MFS transporter [Streptomyces sp. NPDC003247]|uniref:MFS transporter n=1 Tax=Streptomyces sp. NPDC003247 TaxID=3364677 RepID=UPI0036BBE024